ncbi:unnamed protein product, partial [Oikopleura dioica]
TQILSFRKISSQTE